VEEAIERMRHLPFENLGFASVDHHRAIRCGFPEVVFCQGKKTEHIVRIAEAISAKGNSLLATRVDAGAARALLERFPDAEHNETAGTVYRRGARELEPTGLVLVVSAGTSDMPVAEEAFVTARATGSVVEKIYDVGVAGIHRVLEHAGKLREARAIVVVAGMEGALASVIGGLVERPVIAVPTSVGYGSSFGGLAPLLGMLNSCAAGVVVVNIDNGFGAGYAASLINRASEPAPGASGAGRETDRREEGGARQ